MRVELGDPSLLLRQARKKVPVVLQTEKSECAIACLAMILGHFGYRIDLHSLRQYGLSASRGMTLKSLVELAAQFDLLARAVQLDLPDLNRLRLPAILHWNLNHFVVLTKTTQRALHIVDPAVGSQVVPWQEANKSFTGIALELQPTATFSKGRERKRLKLSDLWQRIIGLKRLGAQIAILTLAFQALVLIVN